VGIQLRASSPPTFGVEWDGRWSSSACTVRANRVQVPEAVYLEKAVRWHAAWPRLDVLAWRDGIGQPASRWR
jgi:hypothetical protein